MKYLLKITVIIIFLLASNVNVLALSSDPGSDPTGKSQRQIIEKFPWIDPTACPKEESSSTQQNFNLSLGDQAVLDQVTKYFTETKASGGKENGLLPYSKTFVEAAKKHNIDPFLMAAIANFETGRGTSNAFRNKKNAAGISNSRGPISFNSVEDSIFAKADLLNRKYVGLGLSNIASIGAKYSPPGAANDPNGTNIQWVPTVSRFYLQASGNKVPSGSLINGGRYPGSGAGTDQANLSSPDPPSTSNIGVTPDVNISTPPKSTCICKVGEANTSFGGTSNVSTAFYFFNGKEGINAIQAAGIVGNYMLESGGNTTINPNALNDKGAFGIAQWLGERKERLVEYAKSKGTQPQELNTQLEFTLEELRTNERQALVELKKATTVKEAAEIWERTYERSGGAGMPQRVANSEKVYGLYGASTNEVSQVNSTPQSNCNNTEASSGNLGTSPSGFVFPLKTNKDQILKGNGDGSEIWCYKKQDNCHGTYPAADIFAPPGTVVVAAVPGTVVRADEGCTRSCSVTIKGDDQFLYFYTHMAPGSIKVKKSEKVTAGQDIGQVGSSADANYTPPHLHFDIHNQSYDIRPSCARKNNCPTKGDMINPQPQLISAFNNLPEK